MTTISFLGEVNSQEIETFTEAFQAREQ